MSGQNQSPNLPALTPSSIITLLRYAPGDVIVLNADTPLETLYRYVSGGDAGHTFEDFKRPDEFVQFNHVQMADLARTPGYRYRPGGLSLTVAETKSRTGVHSVFELPAAEAERAGQRSHWTEAFVKGEAQKKFTRSNKSMAAALDAIARDFADKKIDAGNKPSARSLRRWLKAYEASHNIADLRAYYIRRYGRKLLDQTVQTFVDGAVNSYMTENRLSLAAAYSDLCDDINLANHERKAARLDELKAPCYKVFRAFVAARGEFAVYAGRHGIAAAKRKYAMVTIGVQALMPGERVEIDAWEIPLFVLLERNGLLKLLSPKQLDFLKARRWICCAVMDVATKIRLAMRIGQSENADLVLATLEMAMTDKKRFSDAAGAMTPWTQHCGLSDVFADMLLAGHDAKPDHHALCDAEAARALHAAGAFDGLTLVGVARYTGAGIVQTRILLESGFLTPVVASGDISDHHARFSFATAEVDNFLARLQQDAAPVEVAHKDQRNIPLAAKSTNCPTAEILRMILARDLRWVGRLTTETGFRAILVDVREIEEKMGRTALDGLTAHQIEKTTTIQHRVVRALIKHRILKAERLIHPVSRMPVDVVPTSEIQRFQATYVSLFQLARERCEHHMKIKKELDARGVPPAFDPKLIHATFYQRVKI